VSVTERLGSVAKITMGQAPDGQTYNGEGVGLPLIAGAGDFGQVHPSPKKFTSAPTKVCDPGDIVIGIRASIGEKVVADRRYCLGRGVAGLSPRADLDARYLWHWLTNIAPILLAKAKGATFLQVNREDIAGLEIELPSLVEQRRIAEILDKADTLRAKRQAALAQLDFLTQSMFLDMFGDPVCKPKWPAQPLGWLVESLRYGPRFYNEAYTEGGVRVVRISDLKDNGTLDFDAMPRLEITERALQNSMLRAGDIIFARTGATVGKTAVVHESDPPCIAGAYFIVLRFDKRIEPIYARSVLSSASVRQIIARRSRQAAQQNFSGPGLRQLPMPIPPMALQQEYVARISSMKRLGSKLHSSRDEFDSLFDSLQQRAFRGEL
jgi:type I restriction enzyme S subunit